MSTLHRFFHFHEGTPRERAVKVGGAFLAVLALTLIAGATLKITAQESAPCRPAIAAIRTTTTDDTATVHWTTSCAAQGAVRYGTAQSGLSWYLGEFDPVLRTDHVLTITGLSSGTIYVYRVESWADFNRQVQGDTLQFTTTNPATASPPPPATNALAGCQNPITGGPTSVTLRPGIAGQDTVCIQTGALLERVRLVRHNINRNEYGGSTFEVTVEPCADLGGMTVDVPNRTRLATVAGLRITMQPPGTVTADTPILVAVTDARRRLSLGGTSVIRSTDPFSYVAASERIPETYLVASPTAHATVQRVGRTRAIRTSPHLRACAVRPGDITVIPITATTRQPLELVPSVPLYAADASARMVNATVAEARVRLLSEVIRPLIQPNLVVAGIGRDGLVIGRYHVAICNTGLADASGDVTVTATFSGGGAPDHTERYRIIGGIPVNTCRDASPFDRQRRTETTVRSSVSGTGFTEQDLQDNELTGTFTATSAQ